MISTSLTLTNSRAVPGAYQPGAIDCVLTGAHRVCTMTRTHRAISLVTSGAALLLVLSAACTGSQPGNFVPQERPAAKSTPVMPTTTITGPVRYVALGDSTGAGRRRAQRRICSSHIQQNRGCAKRIDADESLC